ncbi:MAG: DUF4931 domain-containing protein [Patescibacteria group bacterium]|nr:DUF4931 domain-containing protein [Patescibacteria group bacterium]
MSKFIPDSSTRRWVVITPNRADRPEEKAESREQRTVVNSKQTTENREQTTDNREQKTDNREQNCAFCPGNEGLTPPEVWRVGGEGFWNQPGWRVRVVPNKYTITDIHEVIIHSPEHDKDIEELSPEQVELIIRVYRQRYQTHEQDGQVMIFCNHGPHAGASLGHPHSQVVVLPRQINLDALIREPCANLVLENTFFNVYCPEFSQWPYEVWIAPKDKPGMENERLKTVTFGEITDEEIKDLADILQKTLRKLSRISGLPKVKKLNRDEQFAYNYYIYHGKNWYLRIIPRFIHRAGFELGTGLSVNPVDPSEAAKELMAIQI